MKRVAISLFAIGVLYLFPAGSTATVDEMMEKARRIAHETIILDGHIDVPYRLSRRPEDISVRTEHGEFDFPRAREGGLDAPFMSIYTPADLEQKGGSKALADELIDIVEGFVTTAPDKFAIATSPAEIETHVAEGRVALCLGMENGSPIEGDIENVDYFFDRGVRYITLAHSKDNHLSDSSYDTTGTNGGLTEFGREVVARMNELGIMVDVSHLSDNAFWDVMEVTRAPVIASHSSCRHFLPGFERNISDEMIKRLAENGGVVQINFGSTFISQKSRAWREPYGEARKAYLGDNQLDHDSPEARAFLEGYRAAKPFPYATVDDVADHIDHIVELVGVEYVGFGSDFDGVGDSLPVGLKDVSQYPNLILELLERGYSEDDIKKIAYQNVFRVWNEVERVAGR